MATTAQRSVPAHLWIVGAIALLWNAFGCFDYLMTMSGDEAYLSQFTPEMIAYWESLPAWTAGMWALGVWGGLVGALLLLMRSRYAVWAFAASLAGSAAAFGYQKILTEMPAGMVTAAMAIMPWVIILAAALQLWYSWAMAKKGVLR